MYVLNRISLQDLSNASIASEATPGMHSSRALVNDSFFASLEKKLFKKSKPCCISLKSDMQLVLRIQKRLVLIILSAVSAVV